MADDTIDKAKSILNAYLSEQKLRRTQERFMLLEYIYGFDSHFNVEMLSEKLKENRVFVSTATVYNTLQLLLACKLIAKYPCPESQVMHYIKSLSPSNLHRTICLTCGAQKTLKELTMTQTIDAKSIRNFEIASYSLVLYGMCSKCKRALAKKKKNK